MFTRNRKHRSTFNVATAVMRSMRLRTQIRANEPTRSPSSPLLLINPSSRHQPPASDILLGIYIPTQEIVNALMTPLKSQVSMGSGDYLYSDGSYARLPLANARRLAIGGKNKMAEQQTMAIGRYHFRPTERTSTLTLDVCTLPGKLWIGIPILQLASRWHWLYRRYCACVIPLFAPQSGDLCLLRVSALGHFLFVFTSWGTTLRSSHESRRAAPKSDEYVISCL
ncbi:hypothetical protein EVAR_74212_1 [Eumeta japonica]|uniref:Uncharacterized protein n=1 Tax=Eumeta variegata TaxID=151549 RepID=A0A4C1SCA5_EUMVA|nr:hypothetical protein EVAR_74212_1 [Eumeta japonica]